MTEKLKRLIEAGQMLSERTMSDIDARFWREALADFRHDAHAEFEQELPAHKASLTLQHNDHLSVYLTARQQIEQWDFLEQGPDWPSDEAKERAAATNEIWQLCWYPDTPVGNFNISAPTLHELMAFAATYK